MKNSKKIIITAAGIMLSSQLVAWDGYVGVKGGASFSKINQHVNLSFSPSSTPALNANQSFLSSGFMGGAYLGLGTMLGQRFYLGAELAGSVLKNKATLTGYESMPLGVPFSVTEKLDKTVSINFRPGFYMTSNNLIFADIGYAFGQFSSSFSADNIGHVINDNLLGTTNSWKKWDSGLRLGLGLSSYFTPHVSLRVEYNYTRYKAFSEQSVFDYGTDPVNTFTNDVNYKPSTQSISLGLTYHFSVNSDPLLAPATETVDTVSTVAATSSNQSSQIDDSAAATYPTAKAR